MSAADESEDPLDDSTERIEPDGRPVISNPARRPEPGADESKALIRTMRKGRRSPGRRRADETGPPEAA